MINLELELQNVKNVAIGGHIRPDGDSIGACLGLMHYIQDNYPQVQVDVWLDHPPKKFEILEGFDQIRQPDGENEHFYDLFIAVDCGDLERLGNAAGDFTRASRTLCVDHHISNRGFANQNEIVPDASSTCEVLFTLMDTERISKAAASALYMGIAHDTGVFQYSCTSPDTMRAAAALMEKGIPSTMILEETYYKKTYLQQQVLGKSLLDSMRVLDGRCIVSIMRTREMEFFGVTGSDLEGIVSQLKLTDGVDVAIFLYQTDTLEFKVSLRSRESVDVSKVASYFGGGGHKRAAGVIMKGTPHDIINNLTLHIERQMTGQED